MTPYPVMMVASGVMPDHRPADTADDRAHRSGDHGAADGAHRRVPGGAAKGGSLSSEAEGADETGQYKNSLHRYPQLLWLGRMAKLIAKP